MILDFKNLKQRYTVYFDHPKYVPFDFSSLSNDLKILKRKWANYTDGFKGKTSELNSYQLLALNTLSVFEARDYKLLPQWSSFIIKISKTLEQNSNFEAIYYRMYFNEFDDFLCEPTAYTYALNENKLLKGMFYPKISECKITDLFYRLNPIVQLNTFYNIKANSYMFDGLENVFNLVNIDAKVNALVNPPLFYIALDGRYEPERIAGVYSKYTDQILRYKFDFDIHTFMGVVAKGLLYKLSDESGAYSDSQKKETSCIVGLIESALVNTRIKELELLYNMDTKEGIRDALISLKYEKIADIQPEQIPFTIT